MRTEGKAIKLELLTFVSWCIFSATFGGILVFMFGIYSFFETDADGWTWGIYYNLMLPRLLYTLAIGSGFIALLCAFFEYIDWQELRNENDK